MNRAFIRVPGDIAAGDVITVKVLIRHTMESGHRRDRVGARIPRNIIHTFVASYLGEEVFKIDLFPGIAANPYFEFKLRATRSGALECRWTDDAGETSTQTVPVEVRNA